MCVCHMLINKIIICCVTVVLTKTRPTRQLGRLHWLTLQYEGCNRSCARQCDPDQLRQMSGIDRRQSVAVEHQGVSPQTVRPLNILALPEKGLWREREGSNGSSFSLNFCLLDNFLAVIFFP